MENIITKEAIEKFCTYYKTEHKEMVKTLIKAYYEFYTIADVKNMRGPLGNKSIYRQVLCYVEFDGFQTVEPIGKCVRFRIEFNDGYDKHTLYMPIKFLYDEQYRKNLALVKDYREEDEAQEKQRQEKAEFAEFKRLNKKFGSK